MDVGLVSRDFVLDRDPAPPPQKGSGDPLPNFRPMSIVVKRLHVWIKAALGMEVGLGPGHIVLDGDTAPLPPEGRAPNFGPCVLWPNGWMD